MHLAALLVTRQHSVALGPCLLLALSDSNFSHAGGYVVAFHCDVILHFHNYLFTGLLAFGFSCEVSANLFRVSVLGFLSFSLICRVLPSSDRRPSGLGLAETFPSLRLLHPLPTSHLPLLTWTPGNSAL